MIKDLYTRLQRTLPEVREWIEQYVEANRAGRVALSTLAGIQLAQFFPPELLASTYVVALPRVHFPPLGQLGLAELADRASMPLAGITFNDTFFVQAGLESQSLYFHETVHVVQWRHLGFDRFLLAYGAGMIGHTYAENPLETIAYALQNEFETGTLKGSPVARIQRSAEHAWRQVRRHFEP